MGAERFRVGQGYDIHRLAEGLPLIVGGVTVPHHEGLVGHSDADVLLHAVTDAVLGAAGLGDIGQHFPDTDPSNQGIDSMEILRQVVARAAEAGWGVANVDCTVVCQRPKLGAYRQAMAGRIAHGCGIDPASANVKMKTNEGLDAVGRGAAVQAQAVVLLARRRD